MDKEMRKSGIIKLVVWSVIALVLIGVLIGWSQSILRGGPSYGVFSLFGGDLYEDAETYNVGTVEYASDEIENIDLSWAAGIVNVVIWDGETFKVEEKGSFDEEDRMRSRAIDGTLWVKFRDSGIRLFGYNMEKELTLYIPVSACEQIKIFTVDTTSADLKLAGTSEEHLIALCFKELNVRTVSGGVKVACGRADSVRIETVSGDAVLKVGSTEKVKFESASGRLELYGELENGDFATVSGAMAVETYSSIPSKLVFESVSGNVSVKLAKNAGGFVAALDTVSGKMTCNGERGRRYQCGDGKASYSFDSVSGNVTVEVK